MEIKDKLALRSTTGKSKPPRLAIIGCGAIAESYYLPALAAQPEMLDSLILVDQDKDRARNLAEMFGVKNYITDYQEILEKVDGAIIALPIHLHHPVTNQFLARSVPVLCEKPIAQSSIKAREMVELADKTRTPLAVNYQQRLWPQFVKVKDVIESGELGAPVYIRYQVGEVFAWPTVSGFYFNAEGSTRGILRDRGAHVLDHICWWLEGKPKVITSQNDALGGGDAVAYIKFEYKNCIGEVRLSWLSSFPCKFTVKFEEGLIEGELYYPQSVLMRKGEMHQKRINLKSKDYSALASDLVNNFIEVVTNGKAPLVSGRDVLDSISFVDDCYAMATSFDMPWYQIQGGEK